MDSINTNQTEDNLENLSSEAAIFKMKELVGKSKTCFFCTFQGDDIHSRPMSVQQIDKDGNLWFLSADDSYKNLELSKNNSVKLYFQGSEHSEFMTLDGIVSISKDSKKIEELWEFVINTWFTGGVNDPRITALKVTPTNGYYWDTKHGNLVAGIKMMVGAVLHKTIDDSVEGNLKF